MGHRVAHLALLQSLKTLRQDTIGGRWVLLCAARYLEGSRWSGWACSNDFASEDCCFSDLQWLAGKKSIICGVDSCLYYIFVYLGVPIRTMIHLQETIRILVPALCDKTFIPCFISLYASSTFESTTFCTIFVAYPSPTNCACPQCVVCDSSTLVDSQKTKFITSYEEWIKRIGLFSPGSARIVAKLRPTRLKFGGIAWNCTMPLASPKRRRNAAVRAGLSRHHKFSSGWT